MKLFTTFIILLFAGYTYGQDSIPKHERNIELLQPGSNKTCEEIKEKATQMASRKEFVSVSYGLMPAPMSNQIAFRNYVLNKYHIKFENKGCVVTPQDLCYAAAMNAAIEKEYGADFLTQEYEAFNNSQEKE